MGKNMLAGLIGGVVVFLWGVVSHMVLPLGESGISALPGEQAVIEAMRTNIPGDGVYMFPGYDHSTEQSPEAMRAWEERYRAGPTGLIVYQAGGREPMAPGQLLTELVTNILAAFLLALVLSRGSVTLVRGGWWGAVLGLFGWLNISTSHWTWYGFSSAFVAAEGIDQIVGWFLAGVAVSALVRGAQKMETAS